MSKTEARIELMKHLQRVAERLDELAIDPVATESQSRTICDAMRVLIPAFTSRSSADMEALGELLATHETTSPRTFDDEAPPAVERRKPPRRSNPAAAPGPELGRDDDAPSPLTGICGHDAEGRPQTLLQLLTIAYFKTEGYSLAMMGHDDKRYALYRGLAMATKAMLLILFGEDYGEAGAAGLGALWAWAGNGEAPQDWQAQLAAVEVSTDPLGLDDNELERLFGDAE